MSRPHHRMRVVLMVSVRRARALRTPPIIQHNQRITGRSLCWGEGNRVAHTEMGGGQGRLATHQNLFLACGLLPWRLLCCCTVSCAHRKWSEPPHNPQARVAVHTLVDHADPPAWPSWRPLRVPLQSILFSLDLWIELWPMDHDTKAALRGVSIAMPWMGRSWQAPRRASPPML
jgi:hypothetical protein